jgi:predicted secreted protein
MKTLHVHLAPKLTSTESLRIWSLCNRIGLLNRQSLKHPAVESREVAPGTAPGAPVLPNLRLKLVATTVVASVVFAAWFVVYINKLITLDQLSAWLGLGI